MIKENIYVAINRNNEIQWVQGSSKKTRYFRTDRYLKGAVEYHNIYHSDDIWEVRKCVILEDESQTETKTEIQNSNKNSNVISVYDGVSEAVRCAMCSNPNKSNRGCDGACLYDEKLYERIMKAIAESVSEDESQIYGNKHNCIMTLFGDCSYAETGCGSCEVVEKVRKVLDKYKLKNEPQIDGILFKGNLKEGNYKLIKTTDGWVLVGEDIVYCGYERGNE